MTINISRLRLPSAGALHGISILFGILAAFHLDTLLRIVYHCIAQRQLTFGPGANAGSVPSKTNPTKRNRVVDLWWKRLLCCFSRVFGPRGIWGVENPSFERNFVVRELIEIGSQTYQAYFLSVLVPTLWLNRLSVTAIFLNCISTPVIHAIVARTRLGHDVGVNRLLCLVVDMMMDFCNSVIIPFVIFVPYWQAFHVAYFGFDIGLLYDDVWYANAIRQNQQIFITNVADGLSTVLPHFSIIACLATVRRIVHPKEDKRSTSIQAFNTVRSPAAQTQRASRFQVAIARYMHGFLCIWGLGVLICHLAFVVDSTQVPECRLHSNAWFVSNFPCVIMQINCYGRGVNGTEAEIDAMLTNLDEKSLGILIVTHCPALEVPPSVQRFGHITGFELYNVSIASWTQRAALTTTSHPILFYMVFSHVEFANNGSTLPEALVHDQFPPSVQYIDMFKTNLHDLQPDLAKYWPAIGTMYLEFCEFDHIPPALMQIHIGYLSLVGNQITQLPAEYFQLTRQSLASLTISSNPLTALPETLNSSADVALLSEIYVESTNISDLPLWTKTWYTERVSSGEYVALSAFGSPACSSANDTIAATACVADISTSLGYYPTVYVVPQRTLSLSH
ncbi:TPA: hypothetical protein N0F65_000799 [Lagenidium giganteum]|uniref:Leucine-rich repeat domain, L domain-like n=1 Tax=Lagenidium giganteum TaxID=4803 RepID=A0AAV2ZCC4_9STRA|nr:TPA: hypothetical protein N0F65_000799 [Lagenidium giganteum]